MPSPAFAFSIASASLKPGLVRLTGVLGGAFSVVGSAGIGLPSRQTLMHLSCCLLYQIAMIEDICGKSQGIADRLQVTRL